MTNREIAITVWMILFFGLISLRKDFRSALGGLLKAAMAPKVAGLIVAYGIYMSAIVVIANQIGLWTSALLKDTLIWFTFTGVAMLVRANDASKNRNYFRNQVRSVLTISIILTFLLNYASLSLKWEIILVPITAFFSFLVAFSDIDANARLLKTPSVAILLLINIGFFVHSVQTITNTRNKIDLETILLSIALGIWLPITAVPFLWWFSLIATYEVAFLRMYFFNTRESLSKKQKLALVLGLRHDTYCVNRLGAPFAKGFFDTPTLRGQIREARLFCKSIIENKKTEDDPSGSGVWSQSNGEAESHLGG